MLDEVCWIATVNDLDRVPDPLLDRFQVIRVDPFTRRERELLVVERLWPDVLTAHGRAPAQGPDRTTTAAERKLARFLARLTGVVPGAPARVMTELHRPPLVLDADAVEDLLPDGPAGAAAG